MTTVIVNGAFVGVVYGLLAVGLAMTYRGSRIVNFAHGEIGMFAAFIFADLRFGTGDVLSQVATDRGLVVALPAALAVGIAIGIIIERVIVRPLRSAPRVRALVGTVAFSSLILTFALRRWGTEIRPTKPLLGGDGVEIAGLHVQTTQILILVAAASILTGLYVLYRFTRFGLDLRAVALDPYAAGLVGINVNRISAATWALAGAIATLSAILIAPLVAFSVFFMTTLTVRALSAALVGGLANISGAFIAGIGIGVTEGIIAFKSPISGVADALLAVAVIVIMLVRPNGLLRSAY